MLTVSILIPEMLHHARSALQAFVYVVLLISGLSSYHIFYKIYENTQIP